MIGIAVLVALLLTAAVELVRQHRRDVFRDARIKDRVRRWTE